MNGFPFDNAQDEGIDLSGLSPMSGGSCPPGYHVGTISKAESKITATGSRMMHIVIDTPRGSCRDRFTISHPKAASDKKAKSSVEIGLRKIKSILEYGTRDGEALNSNRFKGPADLLRVKVGFSAQLGDDFIGKEGETVKGMSEVVGTGRPYFTEGEIAELARPLN